MTFHLGIVLPSHFPDVCPPLLPANAVSFSSNPSYDALLRDVVALYCCCGLLGVRVCEVSFTNAGDCWPNLAVVGKDGMGLALVKK